MRKLWIIVVNVLLTLSIMVLFVSHTNHEKQQQIAARIEAFESMTVAVEKVAVNYLEGEQQVCDVWAKYINNSDMTMEEAADFIRKSHVTTTSSAHLLYTDDGSYQGLSTRAHQDDPDDYTVSYRKISPFPLSSQLGEIGESVNITRAYTNPLTGKQSLAFCNRIFLRDAQTGQKREGILLRIVPVSEFSEKWAFPREGYDKAEISIVSKTGDYIIKGQSFKNTNFFDFYKSYNSTDYEALETLKQTIAQSTGTLTMQNSRGEKCLIAYTPVGTDVGWSIIAYIPYEELDLPLVDWRLIGTIAVGLGLLFLFDLTTLLVFNKRLSIAAREAANANRAKTDFLSTMSHDIRTPMNAIIGLTTIAEKNIDDKDSISECLRKISLASNHLLTLINDILDISKVESGKLALNPIEFSIAESAENLVNISLPMVKEKNIDFVFHAVGIEHEHLFADQLRINQILINILSNAIKYTEPGGRVAVDLIEEPGATEGTVDLTYRVADTGIGMSEEFMARMYQPFSRQTDSRVNSIQGTGLGLAITKQMVELMDGQIECQSKVGVGTTFTVRLSIPIASLQTEEMAFEDLKVLVVDDDEVSLNTAQDILQSLNAKVETANCTATALEKLDEHHKQQDDYDVIIIDCKVPESGGVALTRSIREELGPDDPILLISAYDTSDIEDAARDAGANGFVGKPLFRSALYAKINEMTSVESTAPTSEEDNSDIAGMEILIAEDNDINWEIISALLGMNGIHTDRAENGQVAVDMLSDPNSKHYDLVFMDIQMPVLNGLEATREIRRLPDEWARSIPIIAMTADAFSENVTECLEAGMNGHIAKPVDMKIVLKEIREIKRRSS